MKINGKLINKINVNDIHNKSKKTEENTNSFKELFDSKLNNKDIKISKHAESRMINRNINMTQQLKEKINDAVTKAEDKGVKDSLVLVDDMAFIVNVKSRTVVTAVKDEELKENVFTNIDGAVIG